MSGTASAGRDDFDALLRPRSFAVIGASADPMRIGGRPIAYTKRAGFAGTILPVNPKRDEVQGLACYPSIADLPEVPDVAIVAVPAEAAVQAVADLAARGTRAAIVFTAGFAELGPEGAAAQARMVAAAKPHGLRLLGPNCLGLFNAATGFYPIFSASLENGFPPAGIIGIASQSGAYGTHLFGMARARRVGTPVLVSTGNESDITVAETIAWMAAADEVEVIMAYVEGVRDGDAFVRALEAARRVQKPVVLMKVGRSAVGIAAARSHTASIAGDDAVFDAVVAECGAIRARTTEELLDIAHTATRRIYPVGNTLGVITISGGAGVLISDAAEIAGLPMPAMPAEAQARLKAALPISSPVNPVDCTAQALNDLSLIGLFTEAMVAEGGYRSILAFFTQVGASPSIAPDLARQLNAIKERHPDRLYALTVLGSPERIAAYEADGYLNYEDPARAVVALAAMGRFGEAFAREPRKAPPSGPALALPDRNPTEAEAKAILARAGIEPVPERSVRNADEAALAAGALGFPVVMKILSPDIMHKSEIGGVLLGIVDAEAARAGYATLMERAARAAPHARIEGAIVARQLDGGVECILGIHRDPIFGQVAMFGLGGIFVEIMKDVVLRRCPFDEREADAMIRSVKGAPLLLGARGRPRADIPALARTLSRLSAIATEAGPRLLSIDLNPVLVMPEGQGAFAADAAMEVATRVGTTI